VIAAVVTAYEFATYQDQPAATQQTAGSGRLMSDVRSLQGNYYYVTGPQPETEYAGSIKLSIPRGAGVGGSRLGGGHCVATIVECFNSSSIIIDTGSY
jgi:hypothetical protein